MSNPKLFTLGNTDIDLTTTNTSIGGMIEIESNTIKSQNGTSLSLYNNSNNGLTVATDGNVGVGTTNPSEQLEVEGIGKFNVNVGTALIANGSVSQPVIINYEQNSIFKAFTGIDQNGNYQVGTIGNITFFPNSGTGGNTIINNGTVGIGTTNPIIDLAIGDNDTGLNQEGDGQLAIYTNNNERVRINGTGMGIGVTNPSYKLDVNGDIRIPQNYAANGQSSKLLFYSTPPNNFGEAGINYVGGPQFYEKPGSYINFFTDSGTKLSIQEDGNINITGRLNVVDRAIISGIVGISTDSPVNTLSLGDRGPGQGITLIGNDDIIGFNSYYDGGFKYASNNPAVILKSQNGGFTIENSYGITSTGGNISSKTCIATISNSTAGKTMFNNTNTNINSIAHIFQGLYVGNANVGKVDKNANDISGISMQGIGGEDSGSIWYIGIDYLNEMNFYYNNLLRGWIARNTVSQMNFTGQHRCLMNNNVSLEDYKGLIVIPSDKYINIDNSLTPTINESLPYCELCNNENNKSVFGVISDKEDSNNSRSYASGNFVSSFEKTNSNERRIFINSLGEGASWVCNKNGILTNGDYISSSSVPGYGMKQTLNEGILSNHTVAKMTCDCDFSLTKIVKKKLNTIEVITVENRDKKVSVDKTREETKIEYDENTGRYVQKTITETYTEEEIVYDEVDVYDEEGNIIGKHKVAQKEDYNITTQKIVFDSQGDPEFIDDLDEEGNIQMVYPYETRFLKADGTLLTDQADYEARLANGESVYIACFVGCTYHCG